MPRAARNARVHREERDVRVRNRGAVGLVHREAKDVRVQNREAVDLVRRVAPAGRVPIRVAKVVRALVPVVHGLQRHVQDLLVHVPAPEVHARVPPDRAPDSQVRARALVARVPARVPAARVPPDRAPDSQVHVRAPVARVRVQVPAVRVRPDRAPDSQARDRDPRVHAPELPDPVAPQDLRDRDLRVRVPAVPLRGANPHGVDDPAHPAGPAVARAAEPHPLQFASSLALTP